MEDQLGRETGFNAPQIPQDEYVISLYQKYELPSSPTLKQIEPIAKGLLENPTTVIEGAELVLNRRVDAQELAVDNKKSILPLLFVLPSGDVRFGALLMQKTIEDNAAVEKQSAK